MVNGCGFQWKGNKEESKFPKILVKKGRKGKVQIGRKATKRAKLKFRGEKGPYGKMAPAHPIL